MMLRLDCSLLYILFCFVFFFGALWIVKVEHEKKRQKRDRNFYDDGRLLLVAISFFLSKLETVFKLKCHDDENETVALDNAV